MIKTYLEDGKGSGRKVAVLSENELLVSNFTCPPLLPQKNQIFVQHFTTTGAAGGSNDMGVDGSVTAVPLWIPADEDKDRYLSVITFLCGYGSTGPLYNFADSGGALTNGITIKYNNGKGETVTIATLKQNYDFLRLSCIPLVPTAWELRSLGALNDYGFIVAIPLNVFVPPYGVKLDRGSNQRMTITIQDDCSDADIFNCQAFGFDRFE